MKKEDKRGGWTEMWIRKFQGRHLCKMKNKFRRYAQKHPFTGVGVNCNRNLRNLAWSPF